MRFILMFIGIISLILGIIGAFLPIMPTTPFILLSAACFARSSEKMHKMLIENKYFGDILKNYQDGLGISKKIKMRAIVFFWTSSLGTSVVSASLTVSSIMAVVGVGVTAYLLYLPTFPD